MKILAAFLLFLLCAIPAEARQSYRVCEKTSPLTVSCIISAAEMYEVPVSALLAILDVEGGSVGYEERNRNGTADLGPAQINTVHLPKFRKKFGITRDAITGNGCLNVHLAALLLREQLDAAKGDIYAALGHYHSYRSPFKERYQHKIRKAYLAILAAPERQLQKILLKANHNKDS